VQRLHQVRLRGRRPHARNGGLHARNRGARDWGLCTGWKGLRRHRRGRKGTQLLLQHILAPLQKDVLPL
jgi:hypothetical protein